MTLTSIFSSHMKGFLRCLGSHDEARRLAIADAIVGNLITLTLTLTLTLPWALA